MRLLELRILLELRVLFEGGPSMRKYGTWLATSISSGMLVESCNPRINDRINLEYVCGIQIKL